MVWPMLLKTLESEGELACQQKEETEELRAVFPLMRTLEGTSRKYSVWFTPAKELLEIRLSASGLSWQSEVLGTRLEWARPEFCPSCHHSPSPQPSSIVGPDTCIQLSCSPPESSGVGDESFPGHLYHEVNVHSNTV